MFQPRVGARPHAVAAITDHAQHAAARGQARRLREFLELPGGGIVARDGAGGGGYPQPAAGGGNQGGDDVARQAAGNAVLVLEGAEAIAVIAGQAALGAHPDEAVAVLRQGHGDGVGQAGLTADAAEEGGVQPLPPRRRRAGGGDKDQGRRRENGQDLS
nr:hypothetical protein [Nitrospirillum amazonense]